MLNFKKRIRTKSRDKHKKQVKKILFDIKNRHHGTFIVGNRKNIIRHALGSATYKKNSYALPLHKLDSVLSIDKKKNTAIVEAGCTMENLVKETIKCGLMPCVVPEFRTITVGGAVQGLGIESSSHHFGLFDNTCNWYEVILGDGSLTRVSKEVSPDLFYGLCGSYGSLGYITAIEIQLVKAPKYIQVKYSCIEDRKKAIEKFSETIKKASEKEVIEMIVYSPQEHTLITGTHYFERIPARDLSITNLSNYWSKWFYKHARKMGQNNKSDLVSIEDYLFRHDRGVYWMASYLARPTLLFRIFFGWMVSQKNFFLAIILFRGIKKFQKLIIQDIAVRLDGLHDALDFCDNILGVHPLWCLPAKQKKEKRKIFSADSFDIEDEIYGIDIGIYGAPKKKEDNNILLNKKINGYLKKNKVRKSLHTTTHYAEDEFWSIYDKEKYTNLRKKYSAEEAFVDIYKKRSQ